ncbi:MAG: GHKL domain-containing protein [Tissierellales bacterium]|nr:GHKL domain-containing protein [Tissierellales bacterium]
MLIFGYLLYKLIFLTIFMSLLIEFRFSKKKAIIIITSTSVFILAFNFMIVHTYGAEFFGRIFPLSATLPAFLSLLLVAKSSFATVLFAIVTSIFSSMGRFVGIVVFMLTSRYLFFIITEVIADAVIITLFIVYFRKPYLKVLEDFNKGWNIISLVPTLLMVLIYSLMYYPTPLTLCPENIFPLSIVFILAASFYVIIYINFKNISEFYDLRREKDIINLQLEMHKKEFESIQENIEQAKVLRHDIRHHLITIYDLLNENQCGLAKEYIKNMDYELDQAPLIEYCMNYYINVILSFYIKKGKQEGITFHHEINLPENLSINPVEIGLILANGLDNAIHANMQITDVNKREITIICKKQDEKIAIRITNPYEGTILFKGELPLSPHKGHGYGTRSIAGITEKNHGIYSFEAVDGTFNMTVLFYCFFPNQ